MIIAVYKRDIIEVWSKPKDAFRPMPISYVAEDGNMDCAYPLCKLPDLAMAPMTKGRILINVVRILIRRMPRVVNDLQNKEVELLAG